jgi:hypothetical protein
MQRSAIKRPTGNRCEAVKRNGERCGARPVSGSNLCSMHAGIVDPKEIGRKGGSRSPLTRLRRQADDDLRELARETLAKALRGETVDKQQLDAARSLFSYRADAPPATDPTGGDYAGPLIPDGRRPTDLGDVLAWAMSANASTRAVADAWIAQAQAARAKVVPVDPAPQRVSKESRSSELTAPRTVNHLRESAAERNVLRR